MNVSPTCCSMESSGTYPLDVSPWWTQLHFVYCSCSTHWSVASLENTHALIPQAQSNYQVKEIQEMLSSHNTHCHKWMSLQIFSMSVSCQLQPIYLRSRGIFFVNLKACVRWSPYSLHRGRHASGVHTEAPWHRGDTGTSIDTLSARLWCWIAV